MATPPNNLPFQLTSFIGREREIASIGQRPGATRLLTLTGTGGVGKTRLVLELASRSLCEFPDGTWLVELASITESALVAQAVAARLDVPEQPGRPLLSTLSETLSAQTILLILDTCEHLVGPCAELAERLLGACPHLRILATSREPLGIAGETVWQILPLSTPEPGATRPDDLLTRSEAVRLFAARASAVLPTFAVTEQNAPVIARICRQLDGIPLAVELAAAWVRTLSVEQIAERLGDRLGLLTGGHRTAPPRQQTLRGAIAWSYDLLRDAEQILFARLAVFTGACTLEAIEAVCAGGVVKKSDILHLLARLIDVSMVVTECRGEQNRYRLLESLRLYGREHLVTKGEAEQAYRRHAQHYLALAEAVEPELWGPGLTTSLERLELKHDDLRAALRWSVGKGEAEIALRLASALSRFWQVRGHLSEGLRWLEGGLAWSTGVTAVTRARALDAAGRLARDRGDHQRALAYYEQALALRHELDDEHGIALTLNSLGVVAQFLGDYERAVALQEESLARFRTLGDEGGIALALLTLGVMAQLQGRLEQATTWHEEALARFQELGDTHGVAASLNNLGNLASVRGDYARAEQCYRESAELFRALGDQREVAACLRNLAGVARDRGESGQALSICHESLILAERLGDISGIAAGLTLAARIALAAGQAERATRLVCAATSVSTSAVGEPASDPSGDDGEMVTALRKLLGASNFAAAYEAGTRMTVSEAIGSLLPPVTPTGPMASPATEPPSPLSKREREVAALIQRGLTNRQIAAALFIAERTADTHVEHILAKLGLRSRAQVAAWVAERGQASPEVD